MGEENMSLFNLTQRQTLHRISLFLPFSSPLLSFSFLFFPFLIGICSTLALPKIMNVVFTPPYKSLTRLPTENAPNTNPFYKHFPLGLLHCYLLPKLVYTPRALFTPSDSIQIQVSLD